MASLSFIQAHKLVDLIQSATKGDEMYVRVMSTSRLALGRDPMTPTVAIDLSRESVILISDQKTTVEAYHPPQVKKERATPPLWRILVRVARQKVGIQLSGRTAC